MIARLANIIYWCGCIMAAIGAALTATGLLANGGDKLAILALGGAYTVASYAAGWAVRYVLTGQAKP